MMVADHRDDPRDHEHEQADSEQTGISPDGRTAQANNLGCLRQNSRWAGQRCPPRTGRISPGDRVERNRAAEGVRVEVLTALLTPLSVRGLTSGRAGRSSCELGDQLVEDLTLNAVPACCASLIIWNSSGLS